MTDDEYQTEDSRVKVARDLAEIMRLAGDTEDQALNHARARLMPGGRAMVALAHVGSPDEWAERVAADELRHLTTCPRSDHSECHYPEHALDDDPDDEPPLQTLLFWSEAWRREHGYELDRTPTIETEANFLRRSVNWAWANEIHWDDFCADIRQARVRLENTLTAGKRQDRTRVVCDRCDKAPKLIRVRVGDDETSDLFKCPHCKVRMDRDGFNQAEAAMLKSQGAERYVTRPDAVDVLRSQGRALRTIHRWLAPPTTEKDVCELCGWKWEPDEYPACPRMVKVKGEDERQPCGGELHRAWVGDANAVVQGYCEVTTHRTWLWWPDLWDLHNRTRVTPRRRTVA